MRIFSIICSVVLAGALSACIVSQKRAEQEKQDEIAFETAMKQPVSYAVSIHSIIKYPENKPNEISVPSFFYIPVTVDAEPWLTSMDIMDIIPEERPIITYGVYDLKLVLTKNGIKKWEKMVENDPETGFAFLVDGMLYQTFHPRRRYKSDGKEIVIDGPFDAELSLKLRKQAPLNYLK